MTNLIELRESGISKRQDTLDTFELLETAAIDRARKSFFMATEAAFYIHLILKHRLWRHRKGEDGNPFYERQKHYMQELEAKTGWGRSSIFEYFGSVKFAQQLGFQTVEDINSVGGIHIIKMAMEEVKQAGKIDSKTGRIIEYTNPLKPPDQSNEDFLREKIIQLSPLNGEALRPSQLRDEMRNSLSGRPRFDFDFEPIEETGGWDLVWTMTVVDPETLVTTFSAGSFAEGNVPDPVMNAACRKLFIKSKLEEDESE